MATSHPNHHNNIADSIIALSKVIVGPSIYNVKGYGAAGDGTTSDTTTIQAAIDAANSAGGGVVFFPEGTYITGTLTLYSKVHLVGSGPTATTLKLANSTNAALIQGYDFTALSAGDTTGGIADWAIRDMTLDVNKANNSTTGYGIRVYGYRYILRDLHIKDFKTNGIYSQWGSASSENMEARIDNIRVFSSSDSSDGSGTGVYWLGPHDSKFTGCHFFYGDDKAFHGAHASKASGLVFVNCHVYGVNHTYCWYLEGSGCALHGCIADHATTSQIYVGHNDFIIDGCLVAGAGTTEVGIEIEGSSGASGWWITGNVVNCDGGAIKFNSSAAGGGTIRLNVYQTTGAAVSGTIPSNTDYSINVSGGATGGQSGQTSPMTTNLTMKNTNLILNDGSTTTVTIQGADGAIVWDNDVSLYRVAENILQTDDQMIAADGFRMKTKAGVPTDADTTVDADGVIIIDTTNSDLYCRIGGTWKKVTLA